MTEEEQRLRAYIGLIERLLDCPDGEETQILQAHEDLVDLGFVVTVQRMAQMMEERGDSGAATFLNELARQVDEHLRSPSQQRFDFLIRLLEITENSNGDPPQLLACLQESPELLDQEMLQIFREWGDQILRQVEEQQAQVIGIVLGNFSNVLVNDLPLHDQSITRDLAIIGYRLVLRIFTQESDPQLWAQTHNNLGQAFRNRILGDPKQNLDLAIEHLNHALRVRTPTAYPEAHGRTLAKLEEVKGEREQLDL